MGKPGSLLGPMRPAFLVLTPACILLGLGTAMLSGAELNILYLTLAISGGLCAHISVNTFNEYYDYKSGLDNMTRRTPFSGGSGTLPAHPEMAAATMMTAMVTLTITILTGAYFSYVRGPAILPLGMVGVLIIIAYTNWITRHPLLCLIAPGLGFGPLMVAGTHFVLTGVYSSVALMASLLPFFLVNNLLLANQLPDLEPDRSVGRRNLPILFSRDTVSLVYATFSVMAYLSLIIAVMLGYLPQLSLIGLATIIIAVPAMIGIHRYAQDMEKLIPYLGMNVAVCILTPALVALGCLV